jgi:hypothetical protein
LPSLAELLLQFSVILLDFVSLYFSILFILKDECLFGGCHFLPQFYSVNVLLSQTVFMAFESSFHCHGNCIVFGLFRFVL